MNRVQVVLARFSVRLFCCVQAKTYCTRACVVDVMVMSSA